MRALFLVVLYAGLCFASSVSDQENIELLMDNVLVVGIPYDKSSRVHVPLSCGESYENRPVVWKKDGEEIEPALQGNRVTVLVVGMDGGNYTCHLSPNGDYLNHTVIMTQIKPDNRTVILATQSPKLEKEGGHIHCSAANYNGSFHCHWSRMPPRSKAPVFLVKVERYLEKISCELDAGGSGITCKDAGCTYKEEQHRIVLSLYLRSASLLEAYTKTFYLREIVRPDALPNLHTSDGKLFSWSFPESWEKPCSFFSLEFDVKVVVPKGLLCDCDKDEAKLSDTTQETKFEVKVKEKKFVFCVRARDRLTNGPFSEWSMIKVNRRTDFLHRRRS
ncbi:interleukin-12 subunit beta [Pseudoliparis swirei]|uniref:interleukin-12 subunit beta n=1 Tax=Pseudoliparis swirei TaxID=2059687 RepID=UPI0024BE6C35|nr:interleukin-12 subunit beta [Pseudoliparis swirei]